MLIDKERSAGCKLRRAALLEPGRFEASTHTGLRMARLPVRDEVLVALFRLLGDAHLLLAQRPDVVGVGGPAPVPLLLRLARLQLHGTHFIRDQRWTRPEIVLLLGEQMPA